MTTKAVKTTRKDWRRESTRQTLIETAESLFGQHGIDAISLRQIGSATGSANANVVGYHFGTKEDIVQAIFEHRLPWLDGRRGELYEALKQANPEPSMAELTHALWWPLYEMTNSEGIHSFAGFLAELIRTGRGHLRQAFRAHYPNTIVITTAIGQLMPEQARPLYEPRHGISMHIITGQLLYIDRVYRKQLLATQPLDYLFADALNMAVAAMAAPAP